jgi:hypothetical protein
LEATTIRCASPDCDWGQFMPSVLSPDWEIYMDKCRAAFRQHCIERHHLAKDETDAWVSLNLEHWTMQLVKPTLSSAKLKRC